MIILAALVGIILQVAIGYIVLKFVASVVKSIFNSLVVPAVKAIFTLLWVGVKLTACLMVGGIVIIAIVNLIA